MPFLRAGRGPTFPAGPLFRAAESGLVLGTVAAHFRNGEGGPFPRLVVEGARDHHEAREGADDVAEGPSGRWVFVAQRAYRPRNVGPAAVR